MARSSNRGGGTVVVGGGPGTNNRRFQSLVNKHKRASEMASYQLQSHQFDEALISAKKALEYYQQIETDHPQMFAMDLKTNQTFIAIYAKLIFIEFSKRNYVQIIRYFNEMRQTYITRNFTFKSNQHKSAYMEIEIVVQLVNFKLRRNDTAVMHKTVEKFKKMITFLKDNGHDMSQTRANVHDLLVDLRILQEWDLAKEILDSHGPPSHTPEYALEMAVTHTEQLRLDTSLTKEEKIQLLLKVSSLWTRSDFTQNDIMCSLVIAQYQYLVSGQTNQNAINCLKGYLENQKHIFKEHCYTCEQKASKESVRMKCAKCKLACYCSRQCQQGSFSIHKNYGVRIGHDVWCPLMRKYRKLRQASSEDKQKFLEKFCIGCDDFLAEGLGLKKLRQEIGNDVFVDEEGKERFTLKMKQPMTGMNGMTANDDLVQALVSGRAVNLSTQNGQRVAHVMDDDGEVENTINIEELRIRYEQDDEEDEENEEDEEVQVEDLE
jgi:hypothetical protein